MYKPTDGQISWLSYIPKYSFGDWLVISGYLSSLPVAHLSDDPRRRLVNTGDSTRIQDKLLRIPPGSLTCSVYSTVTRDLGLKSHPKDN